MLTFNDPDNHKIFKTQFPTAWKVLHFAPSAHGVANITYKSQLAVAGVEVDASNIVTPTTWENAGPGDEWSLTYADSTYGLKQDVAGGGKGTVNVTNKTGGPSPIAIGFNKSDDLNILMVETGVGNTQTAQFDFHPVLTAYATSNFQETQLITAQVVSPVLWSKNVVSLDLHTNLTLVQNADGSYTLA